MFDVNAYRGMELNKVRNLIGEMGYGSTFYEKERRLYVYNKNRALEAVLKLDYECATFTVR